MESPVVVGVDGSDASLVATEWAADEAARHGVPLRIVHASLWERYEGSVPDGSADRPSGQVLAENIAGAAAERARRRVPSLTVTTDIIAMDASTALLEAGYEADLLVLGSSGRGEFADLLLGSVGILVPARSRCPVVVVRGDRQALDARHERVLLGVGDHDADSSAVRFAFREADTRNCELDAVRTWRRGEADHPRRGGDEKRHAEEGATAWLDKALEAGGRAHSRVRLRRDTVEGQARKVLVDRSAAADLLVLGARRRGGLVGAELGKVARRALHHASCPVAVVPSEEATPPPPGP
ncbi:universal stress protein [Streptomyces sp. NPDC096079]|uniref:universal stress protein n=1 Tax=Streptomyces sp. NPDC096079 TaxID=3155820 RepID=UPI00331741E5